MTEAELPLSSPESEPRQTVPCLKRTVVNERVSRIDDTGNGWIRVSVSGVPLFSFDGADSQSRRFVCVQLRLLGYAEQQEICAAFGHDRASQYRWERRYEKEGLSGLEKYRPKGRPVSVPATVENMVVGLHGQGLGMRRIAERAGLSLAVVRGVYRRKGLGPQVAIAEGRLFEDGGKEPEVVDVGVEQGSTVRPESESAQEEGVVEDAWGGMLKPRYESRERVPRAGILIALPLIQRFRIIPIARSLYRSESKLPGYGLETVVMLFVTMALWRIRRIEGLKSYSPSELGSVFGLSRVPEMKTVRRKLGLLAEQGKARELMLTFARSWLAGEDDLLGFLYVDGHVRAYSGKANLAKGYMAQRHAAVRATTDVWANDRSGDPVFVVTSEINEGLTQKLELVLKEAKRLVRPDAQITVVFDRGGWSPQLFARLIDGGHHLITYRKGRSKDLLPEGVFRKRGATIEGSTVEYMLHDAPRSKVGTGKVKRADGSEEVLSLRQVTKLCPTGHQTQVLTSRHDLPPEEVLFRMFARWRQENFFKYMRHEFAIDELVDYGHEGVDPSLDRPNPRRLAAHDEIKAVRAKITRLQGQRCELIPDLERRHKRDLELALDGWERYIPENTKDRGLRDRIGDLKIRLQELEAERDEIPERISAGDLERLTTERKLLTDIMKTVAYRIETELLHSVAGHFRRTSNEGRKLIAAALSSPADLQVSDHELRVRVASQSSPHRTAAIAALCADLNKHPTVVPGTDLRLLLSCGPDVSPDVAPPG